MLPTGQCCVGNMLPTSAMPIADMDSIAYICNPLRRLHTWAIYCLYRQCLIPELHLEQCKMVDSLLNAVVRWLLIKFAPTRLNDFPVYEKTLWLVVQAVAIEIVDSELPLSTKLCVKKAFQGFSANIARSAKAILRRWRATFSIWSWNVYIFIYVSLLKLWFVVCWNVARQRRD